MAEPKKAHATFSPSGSPKWIRCAGSLALESVCADKTSKYAVEGTAAHMLAEKCFTDGKGYAAAYEGEIFEVVEWVDGKEHIFPVLVTVEMAAYIQEYVDRVNSRVEEFKLMGDVVSVELLIEQQIDFSRVIGIPEQFGTADVVIVVEFRDGTAIISVEDLKYGMGVKVDALDNEQLLTYGNGVYDTYSAVYDITKINVAIHQIRLGHLSEAMYTAAEVVAFGEMLYKAAQKAKKNLDAFKSGAKVRDLELTPGDKQCRWCKAAATCPALAMEALSTMAPEIENLDDVTKDPVAVMKGAVDRLDNGELTLEELGALMSAADLIDDWLRALRGRVEAELLGGKQVPGWKVVQGKRGNRAWVSTEEAEEAMKAMRLKQDDMYDRKLISPTTAEKLLAKESPRRWKALEKLITRFEGKPSVAPESDKRPALVISSPADEIDDLDDVA